MRTVDFVIRENAVMEDEPSRTPSTAVIHPLVKNAGDSISYNLVYHGLNLPVVLAIEIRR